MAPLFFRSHRQSTDSLIFLKDHFHMSLIQSKLPMVSHSITVVNCKQEAPHLPPRRRAPIWTSLHVMTDVNNWTEMGKQMDYRQKRNTKHLPLAQSINLPGQHLSPLLHNSSITLLTLFSTDPHPLLLIYILRPCVSHLKCLSHSSLGKSEKKNQKTKPQQTKVQFKSYFLQEAFSNHSTTVAPITTH